MANNNNGSGRAASGTSNGQGNPSSLQWSNVYLSSAQKEAAKLFAADPERTSSMIATLLGDGYNLSLAFNESNGSFIATIIGKKCIPENLGWGMSSHGGSWESALYYSLYKYFYLREDMTFKEMSETYSQPLT